ncbi:hypothetical protein Vadar_004935 [Vaccinium darrowii]|uniref:Uncharacterized protein n=1 Tax=Vaccinium darrowii TaxID=229202 RepID=A0ACB7XN86_9ERIC|nr:hypothetical protein Vadar_004935 [Vaccinium darrowii]
MALQISFQLPLLQPSTPSPKSNSLSKFKPKSILTKPITPKRKSTQFAIKATQSTNNNKSEQEQETPQESNTTANISEPQIATNEPRHTNDGDVSDLGLQIKKAMEERGEGRDDFWSGVAEEIREIEWPAFGKVVGTTGVVLGVIAGSSVVLLTVNAVLAELSDRVFAGKGVQDFFG